MRLIQVLCMAFVGVALPIMAENRPAAHGADTYLHPVIFGGEEIPATEEVLLNSIVSIEYVFYNKKEQKQQIGRCTGTVIAPDAILTAAHCVRSSSAINVDDITIVLNKKRMEGAVSSFVPHEDHFSNEAEAKADKTKKIKRRVENDIAIIFLKNALPDSTVPVSIPIRRSVLVKVGELKGTEVVIAGFGRVSDDNRDSRGVLRWARVAMSDYSYSRRLFFIRDKNAGFCIGDSGGPAFIKDREWYLLVGVLVESKCGKSGGILDTVAYRAWIMQKREEQRAKDDI